MKRETVKSKSIGTRLVVGTEWPIEDILYRVQDGNCTRRAYWLIVRGLCNGVPQSVQKYLTKKEALEAFE